VQPIQIILDTNILYAAMRSRNGASFRLISLLPSGKFTINVSVPLVLEYEDVLSRSVLELNYTLKEIDAILDNLCAMANRHEVFYLWRPFLRDPGDDLILELAVKANCNYIVTYNKQDFIGVDVFGVKVVDSREFLQIIGEIP
jgi:putative PIN family toxin of toxin-antitoxin system